MAKAKKKMSVERFLDGHNGAPYDIRELADVALNVEGRVGATAKAVVDALNAFDAALDEINFEVG